MPDNNLDQDSKKGFQLAARVGIEFISGLFVGVLLGYAFDHYFETKPWGMIIFIACFCLLFWIALHNIFL